MEEDDVVNNNNNYKNKAHLQSRVIFPPQLLYSVLEALKELIIICLTCFGPYLILGLLYFSLAIILICDLFKINGYDIVAQVWGFYLRNYHQQTFTGIAHIPKEGAAMLVWYHGPIPVDYMGLVAELYRRDKRLIYTVVDRSLACVPGFKTCKRLLRMVTDGRERCVDLLRRGEIVGVAPGGAREALFGDGYTLEHWGARTGFANVAMDSGAPIIPVFTEDIREAYCTMKTGRRFLRTIFEKIKQPIVPIYWGFPVKLTTHVGCPIAPLKDETAQQLKERVKTALEELIIKHQKTSKKD